MSKATLVYDDDCGFCTWSARRVAAHAPIDIVGFSRLTPELEARLPTNYEHCAHLLTDDDIYSCGASLEEAVLMTPIGRLLRPPVEQLRRFSPYTSFREWVYRWIANHRPLFGRIVSADPPPQEKPADTSSERSFDDDQRSS